MKRITPSTESRKRQLYIGIVGPGENTTDDILTLAYTIGRYVAEEGHIVITGGLGGVMEAACAGAWDAKGHTIGILPGVHRDEGNPFLTFTLPTGLGELRNGLIVRAADAIICVGGSWGTLSEVALAVRAHVPVVSIQGWELPAEGIITAQTPHEAVVLALRLATDNIV